MTKPKVEKKKGYSLHFVDPKDEKYLTDLRNGGKVFGEITVSAQTIGDQTDEVIVAVRG
jgi:hypothetical protein